jgi:tRNA (adenine58-N1)-methyltransferase non-catalytic subunit
VKPEELNAETVAEDEMTPAESRAGSATPGAIVEEDGVTWMKTNQLTVDDARRQALTQREIEEMKKTAAGKEIIEKILANHAGLDEKTVFSKAKYMLRKRSKYLKRFTVLPMEVGILMEHIIEKEPSRILDMREETLGLVMAWSNVHVADEGEECPRNAEGKRVGGGRWLVADETGGLVTAAVAERMGILRPSDDPPAEKHKSRKTNGTTIDSEGDVAMNSDPPQSADEKPSHVHADFPIPALTNTITLLHPAVQPNISLLKHFGYDANNPSPAHPLHTHLKPLSYLQLLDPESDPTYLEPLTVPASELLTWKAGKRGSYFKKRRRWERCKAIVDEAREGGFEGLVIASNMDPFSILPHTVPLIRGGGTVVIYSPTVEPLVRVMDLYSKERRTAYISHLSRGETPDPEDFPLDPRQLLAPTLQTSRIRPWQVLPGRTHPVMTDRGGSEGYVFTARKVVPLEGGIEARGNFAGGRAKRRKVAPVVEEMNGEEKEKENGGEAAQMAKCR